MACDGAEGAPKRKADAAASSPEAKSVVAAPPLPLAKNMMWRERVEYILNWKRRSYPRTGKIDPTANRYDECSKEYAKYQEQIREEVEEKGYVYVPDGYEEEIHRCNNEVFKSAYLKAFGCLPPEDDD